MELAGISYLTSYEVKISKKIYFHFTGLAVATAVQRVYSPQTHQNILVVAGPGSKYQFHYKPLVVGASSYNYC